MTVRVVGSSQGHRLNGDGPVVGPGNGFLVHLTVRGFSPATVAYAFDLANFAGFLDDRSLGLDAVVPTELFDYWTGRSVEWRAATRWWRCGGVVRRRPR